MFQLLPWNWSYWTLAMIALCATKVRTWTSGRKFAFPSVSRCSIRAEPWQFLVWFLTHRTKFIFVWCCSQMHTKRTFETISRAKSEVSKNCKRIKPLSSGSISAAWFRNFWKRRIFVCTQHKHHNAHNYIDKTILQGYINWCTLTRSILQEHLQALAPNLSAYDTPGPCETML